MKEEIQVFSLVKKQIPIMLAGEDGAQMPYSLQELDGRERDRLLGEYTKNVKKGKDGEVTIKSLDGTIARLLSVTLCDPEGAFVSTDDIQAFPASLSQTLYEMSAELNGFGGKKDKDADSEDEEESGK